jgi:hypothetical protein
MRSWNRFLALVLCSALAAPCLLTLSYARVVPGRR